MKIFHDYHFAPLILKFSDIRRYPSNMDAGTAFVRRPQKSSRKVRGLQPYRLSPPCIRPQTLHGAFAISKIMLFPPSPFPTVRPARGSLCHCRRKCRSARSLQCFPLYHKPIVCPRQERPGLQQISTILYNKKRPPEEVSLHSSVYASGL